MLELKGVSKNSEKSKCLTILILNLKKEFTEY